MNYTTTALREHQELAIFLTLAVGFLIGRIKIGSFSLGDIAYRIGHGVAEGRKHWPLAPMAW